MLRGIHFFGMIVALSILIYMSHWFVVSNQINNKEDLIENLENSPIIQTIEDNQPIVINDMVRAPNLEPDKNIIQKKTITETEITENVALKVKGNDGVNEGILSSLSTNVGPINDTLCNSKSALRLEMNPEDLKFFTDAIRGVATYVEWGSGGSTHRAAKHVAGKAYSFEHFTQWCNIIKRHEYTKCVNKYDKLTYTCKDLNYTKPFLAFGNPKKPTTDPERLKIASMGFNYVNVGHILWAAGVESGSVDVVFVDGRWRVACALFVLTQNFLKYGGFLLIHDYEQKVNEVRGYIEPIELFYDRVKCGSTMCMLRPKPESEFKADLFNTFAEYLYIYT